MSDRALDGERPGSGPGWAGEWSAFAGIFIVTNLGLLAVGATLAVLPHYVKDNLNGSDLEVGIVTGAFAFTGSSAARSRATWPIAGAASRP